VKPASSSGHPSAELAHARVARALREGIMSGQYEPGEVMTLRRLAARFDVSPMPVRDALRQLVAERALVVVNANRSVAIPLLDKARLSDIGAVRLNLEGMAASLAAQRATDEQLAAIDRALEESETPGSSPDPARNQRFHFAIYAASGSSVLVPLIESLWLQIGPYIRRVTDMIGATLGTRNDHHHEIVEALKARESERARAAIVRDISRSMGVMIDGIDDPSPSRWARGYR
jgi:DNA-binding GntR family transcriptional regulator